MPRGVCAERSIPRSSHHIFYQVTDWPQWQHRRYTWTEIDPETLLVWGHIDQNR
jgi:hypothetical protein